MPDRNAIPSRAASPKLDADTLRVVRRWVEAEQLVDNTGAAEDEGYNDAIDHVLDLIDGLLGDYA